MKRPETEVVRLQAREAQLSTSVSAMQSQETEFSEHWQKLQQENARINDQMNQIQIVGDPMNNRNQGMVQQLQTSNLELSRLQTEASHL